MVIVDIPDSLRKNVAICMRLKIKNGLVVQNRDDRIKTQIWLLAIMLIIRMFEFLFLDNNTLVSNMTSLKMQETYCITKKTSLL